MGASHAGDDFSVAQRRIRQILGAERLAYALPDAVTDAWSLKIAGAGQTASGPLFLSQQFYLGGAAFGRGYGAAEISGDNGMAGSLELRFDEECRASHRLPALRLHRQRGRRNDGFRYTDGIALTSAGAGVRFLSGQISRPTLPSRRRWAIGRRTTPARDVRVLFSFSSALKLCPSRAATRCL